MIKKALLATVFTTGLALAAVPARAMTFDLDFTGAEYKVQGVMTTANTLNAVGGYDVLTLAGSVPIGPTTGAIIGLIPNPNQPNTSVFLNPNNPNQYWTFNNVDKINPTFDHDGLLFKFGSGVVANLYSIALAFYLSVDDPSRLFNPGDHGVLKITQVEDAPSPSQTPLPAAAPLFASVLGGAGGIGGFGAWRRRRKQS